MNQHKWKTRGIMPIKHLATILIYDKKKMTVRRVFCLLLEKGKDRKECVKFGFTLEALIKLKAHTIKNIQTFTQSIVDCGFP